MADRDTDGGDASGDGDWPVLESEVEYETGWYEGGYDRVRQPDGTEKEYYWAALPPATATTTTAGGSAAQ